MSDQLSLDKINAIILRQIKKIHDNDYANEEIFEIIDSNLDEKNNLVNLRVHVMITQNTLNFHIYAVNILIERFRCTVNGTHGNVSIMIPILNITEPLVTPNTIGIEFATKDIWDNSSKEEIQNHIANEWNKGAS